MTEMANSETSSRIGGESAETAHSGSQEALVELADFGTGPGKGRILAGPVNSGTGLVTARDSGKVR